MSEVEQYDVLEELSLSNGEWYGRLGWSNCMDQAELKKKARPNCISENYEALLAAGFQDLFPCRILGWIHIEPKFQKRGLAKARIDEFIADSKSKGFARIYLKAYYDFSPRWEADRDRQERYYERFGFVCFRTNEDIRPMMLLNL